ncbi:hypothetical protein ACFV2U_32925 [Streptomyces sp. NPDC059697]|uniref:DinB/UmuC family translesion DNA polymerase n=1 Tax=Streptomyces sp. NPDC059697 TaxID=3346912 RepID=UPI0036C622C6
MTTHSDPSLAQAGSSAASTRCLCISIAANKALVAEVRRSVRAALLSWGADEIADDMAVVASELVSKRASPAPGGATPSRGMYRAADDGGLAGGDGPTCVGLLAAIPPGTVQRLLGGRAGRQVADRARGIDLRPITPRALPASASVSRTFPRHTLDAAAVRAALLGLVVTLALQLRGRGQVARGLTLTLRFAGGTSWEKTRRLPEASAHDDDLRTPAYRLIDAAGLQRGRLTAITLKGEDLIAADQVAEQISFDGAREARLAAEEVSDRIRAKFGPGAIRPATTLLRVS